MRIPETMLVEAPHKNLGIRLLALRWPVALMTAAAMPLVLPLPGNPVTLAGFVALIGGAVVVSSTRWLIMILPVLAAIGPYFLQMDIAGVNLFGFRLLIIILAVFSTPLTSRADWWFNPIARYTVLLMVFWILYGALSLLWTPDQAGGLEEILTMIFGLGLILTLFNLKCYAPDKIDMLRFGWVFAFIAVIAQATWEIATGDRLPSHKTERYDTYVDSTMVQSTLGAPGAFAGFLLLTTPFLFWSMDRARGLEKLLYLGMLPVTGFFALYGAARNAFFALILQFATYFLILERRWHVRFAAVACGLVAAVLLANVFAQGDFKLAQKYQYAAERGLDDNSIYGRMILSVNGVWMALETGGRGVGAGGFEETLAGGDVFVALPVRARGVLKPAHNVWAEILSQYGVLMFMGLMILFGWIAQLAWQARRAAGGARQRERGVIARSALVALVGFAFYGIQSGSVLLNAGTWMFLASLAVLGAYLYEERRSAQEGRATAGVQRPVSPRR